MRQKLFTQYNRINLLTTIGIFLVASVAFYFTVKYIQLKQIDNDLKIEEEEIVLHVREYDRLPTTFSVDDQLIEFYPVEKEFSERYFQRVDTAVKHDDMEDFRQLVFGIKAGGKSYKVVVSKSLEDTDHLISSIFWIAFSTILVILFTSFLINRFILKRLWNPFYGTLEAVNKFQVDNTEKLHFPATKTEEFGLMIETLERMTQQAQSEYLALKTFSENASHEIQTPIAIIQSKLDLMIQDPALTNKQSEMLRTIYEAIKRLSRINRSLLTLAKIENRQYADIVSIDLKEIIAIKINDFNELWAEKNISVKNTLNILQVSMNRELTHLLVNNLLSNATKHNYPGGAIEIITTDSYLEVANTSKNAALDSTQLYTRFYKPSGNEEDNGLGLSIIKQICDVSGLMVHYQFEEGWHRFKILVKKEK